jgi:hypothetical protein
MDENKNLSLFCSGEKKNQFRNGNEDGKTLVQDD